MSTKAANRNIDLGFRKIVLKVIFLVESASRFITASIIPAIIRNIPATESIIFAKTEVIFRLSIPSIAQTPAIINENDVY